MSSHYPTAVAAAGDANTHGFHYRCCCVAVHAKRRDVQLDRSQKVLLRVPNGCESCTKTAVEVDREARRSSCPRTRSSPRSVSVARSVKIKHLPSHSNARAVSSSGTPVVSSQSTGQYSGAELFIYSHACPLPIAPSTTARLKSLPAVAIKCCGCECERDPTLPSTDGVE